MNWRRHTLDDELLSLCIIFPERRILHLIEECPSLLMAVLKEFIKWPGKLRRAAAWVDGETA